MDKREENDNKDTKNIDLCYLKSKGLSSKQISKMVGIPVCVIDRHFETQRKYKQQSGVF